MSIPEYIIIIAGQKGAGKTQLCRKLVGHTFSCEYQSTLGNEDNTIILKTSQGERKINLWILNPEVEWSEDRFNQSISGIVFIVDDFMQGKDPIFHKITSTDQIQGYYSFDNLPYIKNDPAVIRLKQLPHYSELKKKIFINKIDDKNFHEKLYSVSGYISVKTWKIQDLVFVFQELLEELENSTDLEVLDVV